jgi:6-phosphofructokinase 1
MDSITRLGVLTGGGDAPGVNSVIRAVVKAASNCGISCVGLEDSFDGLIEPGRSRALTPRDVTGILRLGGTILGTTNRGNPFAYPVSTSEGTRDYSDRVVDMFHKMGLGALVVIGGDGTLGIAHRLCARGIPIVGGAENHRQRHRRHDQLLRVRHGGGVRHRCDRSAAHDGRGASSHHGRRGHGRYAGWIALYSGVAGGADAILIPEIPFGIDCVAGRLRERDRLGAKFSIVVVAEGAFPLGGSPSVVEGAREGRSERLGGIGAQVCEALAAATGKETRSVVLGHLQRGGAPTSFDRVLATRFGGKAVELVRRAEFGTMVALDPPDIAARPLEEVVGKTKTVPVHFDLLTTARHLGVTFGD